MDTWDYLGDDALNCTDPSSVCFFLQNHAMKCTMEHRLWLKWLWFQTLKKRRADVSHVTCGCSSSYKWMITAKLWIYIGILIGVRVSYIKLYYIMPGYHHGHNYGQCYINLYYIMYHNVISQLLVIVGYIPTIGVITMDIATPWP